MPVLEAKNVRYAYGKQSVLKDINIQLEQGKMYAALGPSRCDKTTLLSLLGGLDSPTSGQILYQREDIAKTGLAEHRRDYVAFIFQSYNLIDYLTPAENVALISSQPPLPILKQLGLTEKEADRNALKLSGGQQQRVAIARALASDAKIILAKDSAHKSGRCVVMVTHSSELAKEADVVMRLRKGALQIFAPDMRAYS